MIKSMGVLLSCWGICWRKGSATRSSKGQWVISQGGGIRMLWGLFQLGKCIRQWKGCRSWWGESETLPGAFSYGGRCFARYNLGYTELQAGNIQRAMKHFMIWPATSTPLTGSNPFLEWSYISQRMNMQTLYVPTSNDRTRWKVTPGIRLLQ